MDVTLPSGVTLRPIPESPNDDYMAGTDGNIYSRTRYKGFGKKVYVDWYRLKGRTPKGKGYRSVSLCHNNVKVTKNVHRLVCSAFHGPPPSPSSQVRHLDGTRDNNVPTNLRWGTQVENWQDREAHGHGLKGEKHHQAIFTDEERRHIQWAVQQRLCSARHASRILGASLTAIQGIVAGKWDRSSG